MTEVKASNVCYPKAQNTEPQKTTTLLLPGNPDFNLYAYACYRYSAGERNPFYKAKGKGAGREGLEKDKKLDLEIAVFSNP